MAQLISSMTEQELRSIMDQIFHDEIEAIALASPNKHQGIRDMADMVVHPYKQAFHAMQKAKLTAQRRGA